MTTDNLLGLLLNIAVRIAAALVIILVGRFLARRARETARQLLGRYEATAALGPSIVRLLSEAVFYVLFALALGLAVIVLGVPPTFVLTASAIVLVILAVALQQSLTNFAATVIFLLFQPFRRDELVETMGQTGTVKEILLFNTVIELGDKKLVSLPNGKIQENGIINYTRMQVLRADVFLTVSYRANLGRVRAVLNEIAAGDPRILADPPFAIVVDDLGDNGVRLIVRPWVAPLDYWDVRFDLRERIKVRFDQEGIAFALPQRDVHLPPPQAQAPPDGAPQAIDVRAAPHEN